MIIAPDPAPWQATWLAAAVIFAIAKIFVLARARRSGEYPEASRATIAAWLLLWPGLEPERELRRRAPGQDARLGGRVTAAGWMALGVLGLAVAAAMPEESVLAGVVAAASCVLVLHFGLFRLAAVAWSARGHRVRPLMDAPGFSASLAEFWGRRWNAAFAALARRAVLAPLSPRMGARAAAWCVFAFSGLVHELVLSLPAGGGWGGPLAYFLVQGSAADLERSPRGRAAGLGSGNALSRAFALAVVLVPLPLLLNEAVLLRIALPTARAVMPEGVAMNDSLVALALWLAVVAHASVLLAGVQVPRRLRWREELRALSRFNRRLMWVYHGFIGFIVVSFGALTALLHDEMLRGDRAAVALAALIATFWTARLVVDLVVYRSEDWPRGRRFAIGHALLVVAFAGMSFAYWSVVARAVAA